LAPLVIAQFNLALGDDMSLAFREWLSANDMAARLRALPHEANSGDVYGLSRPLRP
jgi:hypothetical protein